MLKSVNFPRHYIGCTTNLRNRLNQHNKGETKSTKSYRPWKVLYYEKFEEKGTAYKREWFLKHPVGYQEKIDIIKKMK